MKQSQLPSSLDSNYAYRTRVVDTQVSEALETFGGIVIEGPKWCGKTWTGRHHAASVTYADDPQVVKQAALAPDGLLQGPWPRLVDEWQDAPVLFDRARRIIDDAPLTRGLPSRGLFVFTGSAVPPIDATSHSGTGRFARLRMRPMSLFESGDSTGAVSLASLWGGERIDPVISTLTYEEAVRLICRGGWPASCEVGDKQALRLPTQYLAQVCESDVSRVDGVVRDPRKVLAVIRSLARNSATLARVGTIHSDVADLTPHAEVSVGSVRSYLAALTRIFVTEDLPPWRYSLRSKSQLAQSSKRHLTDPSLAVAALEATADELVADPETVGLLFESLCIRDLRVYAQADGLGVFHYRDAKGLEADAIVKGRGERWGAVEIKLGSFQHDDAAKNLLRLKNKLVGEVPPPSFLMILTASGGIAHTRDDGVHVIPLDRLGP